MKFKATLIGFTAILMWSLLASLLPHPARCRRSNSPPSAFS